MSTLYIVMLRRNIVDPPASYRENRLEQYIIHPGKFGANDDVQPGRTSIYTKCFHSGEDTTKVMKIDDVPQGVRWSYLCLYP